MGKENAPLKAIYMGDIILNGFRGFKDNTVISFTNDKGNLAQWTVILGENGTSKTGVLQAISSSIPVYDKTFVRQSQEFTESVETHSGWIPKACGDSSWLNWWMINRPRNRSVIPKEIKFTLNLFESSNGIVEAKQFEIKNQYGVKMAIDWNAGVNFQLTEDSSVKATTNFSSYDFSKHKIAVFSYAATRLISDRHEVTSKNSQYDSIFHDHDQINSPENWLLALDHSRRIEQRESDKEIAEKAYNSAIRCLIKVLPDIEDIKITKTSSTYSMESEVRAQFKCPFGWVFFEELGQGYKSMASWAVDLLKKLHHQYSELAQPETGSAVVLIDEFDLHLHPKWQFGIMNHLSSIFINCQFIVTAHSPLLVQGAGTDTNLVVLKQEQDADGTNWIVADSDPVHVRGWRLDQIITSDLFGFSSARPVKYKELFEQRAKLASKANRSEKETEQMKKITDQLNKEAPPSISKEANDLLGELNALRK